ncbi:hypothetical protein MLD38_009357 [Melastoma candidum]|uniref:Uncharacterized protein n=1 Tax=Melastoma candidum TaxID=119954 RepID=A0ACB9RYQ2_9MYRT|nr:hypothetical protein MLD38_009357 [Melastoma candidum]
MQGLTGGTRGGNRLRGGDVAAAASNAEPVPGERRGSELKGSSYKNLTAWECGEDNGGLRRGKGIFARFLWLTQFVLLPHLSLQHLRKGINS